ncbi:MAG: undecaprenyldiphospho-muramoylpentapeptide beta-N-acetylglucosaminyltransferase [Candidatus Arcticimaribacter sp.]|nr:undecaprenyldiphospho-muramoylpentapeptide beta-N-acetylglucosaminyltransferase [Flavobacteriaceae bacterium]PSR10844.1 MAG: undecaprenyldiphospho-muramoylpentapeptide beta-N-acetylglucosaminyltransferase [Candidatus Arcticimaribacter sp.]PTM01738.1 MAG: undecaprenyldiphospho-muramoylpentapeptide beta-N-acetylglucosaminyltransferase [Candidatus Arcticimaribacter sp.]
MKPYKFIISGGGTGGHIYPAIAIADALKLTYPDAEFLFVGAYGKMEMEKVPKAGYPIKGIWIAGLQRGSFLKNILFPLKLVVSFFQSVFILLWFRPNFAIGTGGFASGPILFIAHYLKIKTLIQEQNSFAGITNRALSKIVNIVAVAFDDMDRFFPKNKIILAGNPVREALLEVDSKRSEGLTHFKLKSSKKTILILGGSLGAQKINETIAAHLPLFSELGVQLIWQCGKLYFDQFKEYNEKENVQVYEFIQEMDLIYAAADVLISRAGASSISELALVGKPVLLIPSPNVADNHQYHNALALSKTGGALVLLEKEIDSQFQEVIYQLLAINKDDAKESFKKFARPNATQNIVLKIKNELKP